MINTRTFSANVGDTSTGKAGPDAIETDIDNLLANDQELLGITGNKTELETDLKTNLVAAINEQEAQINSLDAQLISAENKTYYINATNGNDTNNGLTSATAFKTWAKTESLIPRFIKHVYVIRIIGNLNEDISLSGRIIIHKNGSLLITGDTTTASNHTLNNVSIISCIGCSDTNIKLEYVRTTGIIQCHGSFGIIITNCEPRVPNSLGVRCIVGDITVLNCNFGTSIVNIAILAQQGHIYSENNTGVANSNGLNALRNGVIGKGGTQPTGSVSNESTMNGGVIR